MTRLANIAALGTAAAGVSGVTTGVVLRSATDAPNKEIAEVAVTAAILAALAAAPAGLLAG
jgi:hypothetical protein